MPTWPKALITCLGLSLLTGCAATNPELISDSKLTAHGTGAPVMASAETEAVATQALDSADDPEIWIDPQDSSRAVILATDKKAGIYVHDLGGKVLQFLPVGTMNNVDLRGTVIGASDRTRNGVALFTLDPATLKVSEWGFADLPTSEAYGFCMGTGKNGVLNLIVVGKNGDVVQATLATIDGGPVATEVRRFAVGSQSEGCVVDDATGALYIAEENVAIWRYDLDPVSGPARAQLASAPSNMLTADIEGLTLLRDAGRTYLIASSQGDSAFAVWRIDADAAYQGRFSVYPGHGIDAVTGTDGVAALGGKVGPYGEGVVVMQDDSDTDGESPATARQRQNFKIVAWADIKAALEIK